MTDTPKTVAWIEGHRIETTITNWDTGDKDTEELVAQIESKLAELKAEVEL